MLLIRCDATSGGSSNITIIFFILQGQHQVVTIFIMRLGQIAVGVLTSLALLGVSLIPGLSMIDLCKVAAMVPHMMLFLLVVPINQERAQLLP